MRERIILKGVPYYSAVALAEHLGIGYRTILRWRDAGRLPGVIWIAGKQYWPLEPIEERLSQGDDNSDVVKTNVVAG